MTKKTDHVLVMGAGAIGMLLGAYLQIGGKAKVSLVGREPHMKVIKSKGLQIEFPDHVQTAVRMNAYTSVDQVPKRPDWVILTVRTYQTAEAMQDLVRAYGVDLPVVTFQNGYALEEIQRFVGENAIGGSTLISAKITGPGQVLQPQRTGLYLGETSGQLTTRVERMQNEFEAVRSHFDCMEAFVTDNIRGVMWAKLAVNATNNTLSAVTDLSVRGLYETDETQRYGYGLVTEVFKVAALEGVDAYHTPVALARDFIDNSANLEQWRAYLLRRAPSLAHFKLSMADMLMRGIRTEVDHINGYVVERARMHQVSAPHHEAIVQAVHRIEQGEIKPGLASLPKME